MTPETRKALKLLLLCGGGVALLLHPVSLLAFGAGAWVGCRGRTWLDRMQTR